MTATSEPIDSSTLTRPFTYLAMGDSYTIGERVARANNFPNQLADSLSKNGFQATELINIASTGWTTDDLKRGIVNSDILFGKSFDVVTLLIGVNNIYQGRSLSEYEKEFEELLRTAIDFAEGDSSRIVVLSIPDYAFTPFGNGATQISDKIDQFNASNASISASYNVKYINITDISRRGLDEPDLVASDGLHPSAKQYELWVVRLYTSIEALLTP